MRENSTGFLAYHQQKCIWDLMLSFNTQEGENFHFQMQNILYLAINTGASENGDFHNLIISYSQRKNSAL